MFTVSKTPKPGKCPARRCNEAPFAADHPDFAALNPYALCERHAREWVAAGKPELAPVPETAAEPRAAAKELRAPKDAPPLEAEIERERGEARQALALCQTYAIAVQADADRAGEIMGELKRRKRVLEEKRVEITRPINESLRKINQLFKPVIEYYDSCERALKGSLAKFLLAQQATQDAALAQIAAAGGEATGEVLAVAHGVENVQAPATVSARTVWRVVSIDLDRLPKEYLIADVARIEREVRERGGDTDIPGVTIERDIKVINRA